MYSALLPLLLNKLLLLSIGHWNMLWNLGRDPAWGLTHKLQRAKIYGANCSLIWVFLSHTALKVNTDFNLQCQDKRTQLPFVGMCSDTKIPYLLLCRNLLMGKQEWLKPLIPHLEALGPLEPSLPETLLGAVLLHSPPHHIIPQGGTPLASWALGVSPWDLSCAGAPQGDITQGSMNQIDDLGYPSPPPGPNLRSEWLSSAKADLTLSAKCPHAHDPWTCVFITSGSGSTGKDFSIQVCHPGQFQISSWVRSTWQRCLAVDYWHLLPSCFTG